MHREVDRFLEQLRNLNKRFKRYTSGNESKETVVRELERVLAQLNDDVLMKAITAQISAGRPILLQRPNETLQELNERRAQILPQEMRLAHRLAISRKSVDKLVDLLRAELTDVEQFVGSVDELRSQLQQVHDAAVREIEQSKLLPRRSKKRQRSKAATGMSSAVMGIGILVADSKDPPMAAFSYGLGGSALHASVRDLIEFFTGEWDKESV